MKFLKENSYDVVKLIINQIGIAIFSMVLYTAVGILDDDALTSKIKVLLSIFATAFYFVLLYTSSWDLGAKDKTRVDSGKLERRASKGTVLALFANLLNIVLASAAALMLGLYMLGNGDAYLSVFNVINVILRLACSMYLGILQGVFISFEANTNLYFLLQSVGYIITPLFAVLVTHFGYVMGLNEKRIFPQTKNTGKKK